MFYWGRLKQFSFLMYKSGNLVNREGKNLEEFLWKVSLPFYVFWVEWIYETLSHNSLNPNDNKEINEWIFGWCYENIEKKKMKMFIINIKKYRNAKYMIRILQILHWIRNHKIIKVVIKVGNKNVVKTWELWLLINLFSWR